MPGLYRTEVFSFCQNRIEAVFGRKFEEELPLKVRTDFRFAAGVEVSVRRELTIGAFHRVRVALESTTAPENVRLQSGSLGSGGHPSFQNRTRFDRPTIRGAHSEMTCGGSGTHSDVKE